MLTPLPLPVAAGAGLVCCSCTRGSGSLSPPEPAGPGDVSDGGPAPGRRSEKRARRILNAPNVLGMLRLAGTPALVALAWLDRDRAFLWLLIALWLTDWIDGKLARLLDQRTAFGARLDSVADAAMYAALALGAWWLHPDVLRQEAMWLAAAGLGYVAALFVGFVKFGRMPTYHTRGAKTCWLLVGVAAILLFAGGPSWPVRIALIAVTLTNLEAIAITAVLRRPRSDVPSLYHAWRIRRVGRGAASPP